MPWRVPSESLTGLLLSQLESRLYAQDSKLAPWLKLKSLAAAKIAPSLLCCKTPLLYISPTTNGARDSPL
jgi:hypothetical protein